jgi:predicted AAA+ superfamily ATPase
VTYKEMASLMDSIFEEVKTARDAGQKEYARSTDDVHANFKRVAELTGQDPKSVIMTYMYKHIDGIAAYTNGHKSQREDVRGRITDCITYLFLLWGYIDCEEEE